MSVLLQDAGHEVKGCCAPVNSREPPMILLLQIAPITKSHHLHRSVLRKGRLGHQGEAPSLDSPPLAMTLQSLLDTIARPCQGARAMQLVCSRQGLSTPSLLGQLHAQELAGAIQFRQHASCMKYTNQMGPGCHRPASRHQKVALQSQLGALSCNAGQGRPKLSSHSQEQGLCRGVRWSASG